MEFMNYHTLSTSGDCQKSSDIFISGHLVDYVVLYSYLHVHSASQRHNIKDRRTQKDAGMKDTGRLLYNYIYLSLYCKGLRVRGAGDRT